MIKFLPNFMFKLTTDYMIHYFSRIGNRGGNSPAYTLLTFLDHRRLSVATGLYAFKS